MFFSRENVCVVLCCVPVAFLLELCFVAYGQVRVFSLGAGGEGGCSTCLDIWCLKRKSELTYLFFLVCV